MKATTSFALLFTIALVLSSTNVFADSSSGESAEQKTRRDTCGSLCHEPPPASTTAASTAAPSSRTPTTLVPSPPPGECVCTPAPTVEGSGSGSSSGESSGEGGSSGEVDFHSHCELIEVFYNFTVLLSVQQQQVWLVFVQEIENTILANFSITDEEKVVLVSLQLSVFFSEHVEIYDILSFQQIGSWGLVIDFLYVKIDIELEITQPVVTLDQSNSCELIVALQDAIHSLSGNDQSAVSTLIVDIQVILEDSSFTYEQQLAQIYLTFQSWFVEHQSLESFVISINIESYGSITAFLDVCQVYWRITELSTVISGSSTSDCVLLAALEEASNNGSFSLSEQAEVLQLLNKLQVFFGANITISARLEYISQTCFQMFVLEPFMVQIIEQITLTVDGVVWGSIYDIIFCSGICHNYGCGSPGGGLNPATSAATSVATSVATTQSPSTTVSSSTTGVVPANCGTISGLITVDVTTNTTVLTTTLNNAYATFTSSQKLGANTLMNKVRNACWDPNHQFPTNQAKFAELQSDFLQYNNNSVTQQNLVFNITIVQWHGTIRDFVGCCGSANAA